MVRSALAVFIFAAAILACGQNTPPKQPLITLQRTACLGSCPVYKLAIYGDGSVVYEGEESVRVKGVEKYRIDADAVRQLADKFVAAHYFSFESKYVSIKSADGTETMVTDLPSTYTSFTWEGRTKKIDDYVVAPKELHELEKEVDRVAKVHRYVTIDAETVQQKAAQGWSVKSDEGKRLLWDVVREGDVDAVRAFLKAGSDPNDTRGDTGLLFDAGNADVIRALIAGGADVHWKSNYGTALFSAAASGDLDSVTTLLGAGVQVNETDSEGETALMKAASEADPEVCRLLLGSGATAEARDRSGHDALDHAREGQKVRERQKEDPFTEQVDPARYQATLQMILMAAGAVNGRTKKN